MSAIPAPQTKASRAPVERRPTGTGRIALRIERVPHGEGNLPRYWGEFWTSKQRQACSLHEISYRACFKAQLPRYFVELLTNPGQVVYDPFSGRGTTVVEAALLGRRVIGNDVNPLSAILTLPRLQIPRIEDIARRLETIPFQSGLRSDIPLGMFYHRRTESEIVSLRDYLARRKRQRSEDSTDRWIRMVATNRLTGHSPGFFSVYTLPPNQAISPERQLVINRTLKQKPEYRDVRSLILRKSRSLLRSLDDQQRENLLLAGRHSVFLTTDACKTPAIRDGSVDLTVTSPPFLDVVDYVGDNWLRCWFNRINAQTIARHITQDRSLDQWRASMQSVFLELFRITKSGGRVAFEVGEVRNGTIALDEAVLPIGETCGFSPEAVYINTQEFTKTANIWGIQNNRKGTNSNRIVLFRKP